MYQFSPFEEISIVSNSSHLKLRQDMSDTIWKYYPSFDLIKFAQWFQRRILWNEFLSKSIQFEYFLQYEKCIMFQQNI
jgi:hypothetical protein